MINLNDLFAEDKIYSVREVSEILRVSRVCLLRWIRSGLLADRSDKYKKTGGMYLIKGIDVINYLAKFNE